MNKKISIYDLLIFGIKSTLSNIRLFILSMITFFSIILVSLGIGGLLINKTCNSNTLTQMASCQKVFQRISLLFSGSNKFVLIFFLLLFLVVTSGLAIGFFKMSLELYEKGKSNVSVLFSCFHLVPKVFVASLIVLIVILLGLILFIIPGIILILRLRYFMWFLIDKNTGIIESLRKSYYATRGFTWEILGLSIVSIVIPKLLSIFAFPVTMMTEVAMYKKLSE